MTTGLADWSIKGRRLAPTQLGSEPLFDGVDLALTLTDGSVRALGIRCTDLMTLPLPERDLGWEDGYTPIVADLDLSTVRYWNFDEVLWVGPRPRPCLFWSNAVGFTEAGLGTVLASERASLLLAGPAGEGLPRWDEVAATTAVGR